MEESVYEKKKESEQNWVGEVIIYPPLKLEIEIKERQREKVMLLDAIFSYYVS